MTTKKPRSGKRFGTALRGFLQDAYDERGSAFAHLYATYSLKAKRDAIQPTDLRFLHFLLREGEPNVVKITYQPKARSDEHKQYCSAEYISRDRTLYLECVRYARGVNPMRIEKICTALKTQYPPEGVHPLGRYDRLEARVITEQEVVPGNDTRLRNWNRVLVRFASTRHVSLSHARQLLLARLETGGACDIYGLQAMHCEHAWTSQLLSAAIEAAATGECLSDLSDKPFSMRTKFWLRGRE